MEAVRQPIGAYELIRRLGPKGPAGVSLPPKAPGSGAGWLVRRIDGRPGVLELHLVDPRPRTIEDALEELAHYGRIAHPALEPVIDSFEHQGQVALVLEREDGVRLDRLKGYLDRDRERLPDAAVWLVGARLCGALAAAHAARDRDGEPKPLVHGSLSLRDLLVTWRGDVRLLGLCPIVALTRVEDADPPSRAWIAPEVRRGALPTPASDAYAAALMVRSLLTGRPPPSAGNVPPLVEVRPDVPAELAATLDRVVASAADVRADGCAELAAALAGRVREAEGAQALRDFMELYQALWGLWSVATPEPWSQEIVESLAPLVPEPLRERAPRPPEPAREPAPQPGPERAPQPEPERAPQPEPPLSVPVPSRPPVPESVSGVESLSALNVESEAPRTSRSPGTVPPQDPDRGPEPAQDPDRDADEADRERRSEPAPGPDAEPEPEPDAEGEPEPETDAGAESEPEPEPEPESEPAAHPAERSGTGTGALWVAIVVGALIGVIAWFLYWRKGPEPAEERTRSNEADAGAADAAVADAATPPAAPVDAGPAAAAAGGGADAAAPDAGAVDAGPADAGVAVDAAPPLDENLEPSAPEPLLWNEGYLTIQSSIAADVYVFDRRIGRTNQKLKASCERPVRVRLARPGPEFITAGEPVIVKCGAEKVHAIEPPP
jgi:hypothetical protein